MWRLQVPWVVEAMRLNRGGGNSYTINCAKGGSHCTAGVLKPSSMYNQLMQSRSMHHCALITGHWTFMTPYATTLPLYMYSPLNSLSTWTVLLSWLHLNFFCYIQQLFSYTILCPLFLICHLLINSTLILSHFVSQIPKGPLTLSWNGAPRDRSAIHLVNNQHADSIIMKCEAAGSPISTGSIGSSKASSIAAMDKKEYNICFKLF